VSQTATAASNTQAVLIGGDRLNVCAEFYRTGFERLNVLPDLCHLIAGLESTNVVKPTGWLFRPRQMILKDLTRLSI
jgi:hypothetical protein